MYLPERIDPRKKFYCNDLCRKELWCKARNKEFTESARTKALAKTKGGNASIKEIPKQARKPPKFNLGSRNYATSKDPYARRQVITPREQKITERDIEYWAALRRSMGLGATG